MHQAVVGNVPLAVIFCVPVGLALGRPACRAAAWMESRRGLVPSRPSPARSLASGAALAAAFSSLAVRLVPSPSFLGLSLLAASLVVASLVDLDCRLIPNGCILAGVAARLLSLAFAGASGALAPGDLARLLARSAISACAAFALLSFLALVMDRILGGASVGGGDVKLVSVVALHLGLAKAIVAVLVACALGIASWSVSRRVRGSEGRGDGTFAWGPSIAVASWLSALWGDQAVAWYLSLLA